MCFRLPLQSFCRKFVWHRECLWPEDLPEACMLVLAAKDDLVPSALVRAMLIKKEHACEARSSCLFYAHHVVLLRQLPLPVLQAVQSCVITRKKEPPCSGPLLSCQPH